MIVIVGLGNPGKEYGRTYHNMGYMAVDAFADKYNLQFTKTKYNSMYAEGMVDGQKVVLLKPTTYMNNSGLAVAECVRKLKLPLNNLLVVYDDIDMPMGQIRLRSKGSAGTHNGMRNIVQCLGSDQFARLRIGIGRDTRMDLKDYVLGTVSSANMEILNAEMDKIVGIMHAYTQIGDAERIDINNY